MPDKTPSNPLGAAAPASGPIPAPGRPTGTPPDNGAGEAANAPLADRTANPAPLTTDAATLAALVATADQHGAEIEAMASAIRAQQRTVMMLAVCVSYLLIRNLAKSYGDIRSNLEPAAPSA